jgi:predicted NAD/FAD-binding protein
MLKAAAGAYWRYGFHQDGVNSALRVPRSKEFTYNPMESALYETMAASSR